MDLRDELLKVKRKLSEVDNFIDSLTDACLQLSAEVQALQSTAEQSMTEQSTTEKLKGGSVNLPKTRNSKLKTKANESVTPNKTKGEI